MECRLRDRQETHHWFLVRGVPLRGADERIVKWFGTSINIHQQKQCEAALQEADQHKARVLAMLSHELRNPLGPICNAVQILRLSKMDDPTMIEVRDVIDRQIHHIVRVVNDMLDVFQITQQKIELHRAFVELVQLVRQSVDSQRRALDGAGLKLTLELPREPVWVVVDRLRLGQVLSHLLGNAIKFSNSDDEVTVQVGVDTASQRVNVAIRDSGIGIAQEVLPHLFETFSQADDSLDRHRGGLGLGLRLVKGIIELHGGQVQVSSPGLGRGTEVGFWLPLSHKPRVPEDSSATCLRKISLRILIIEDNKDAARTLQTLLRRFGHEVKVAFTGTGGVAMAQQWLPDLVLCDLGLPEMDGYEVATVLRQDPATAALPLIAVSGYNQEADRQRSKDVGFDMHLAKPIDPLALQGLLAVLAERLSREPAEVEACAQ